MIERVINSFPRPWVRLSSARGLTLTHGDAHTWNFLFPRAPDARRVYLIDWQLWHPHVGARDLAFMMTIFWYPERRARMELPLLRRYHEKLIEGGVRGYRWEDCWDDYRRSAVRNIFIPLIQRSRDMGAWYWWSNFERAMLAFEDLRCAELIED
jgi:thiamine kinase-like enzyme